MMVDRIDTESNYENKKGPALVDFLTTFNYSDAFRKLHGDFIDFTFYRQGSAASRLDRFYVPQYLVNNIKKVYDGIGSEVIFPCHGWWSSLSRCSKVLQHERSFQ